MLNAKPLVRLVRCVASAALVACGANAQTLTPYAVASGFTLEPWASSFPTGPSGCVLGPTATCVGPLGMAYRPDLGVLVTTIDGDLRLFSTFTPVGGPPQSATAATVVGSYGFRNAFGLAQIPIAGPGAGFNYYMAQQTNGLVVEIAASGGAPIRTVASVPMATALIAFPFGATAPGTSSHVGHLFATQGFGGSTVFEIDPALPAASSVVATYTIPGADGLNFTPSGALLFAACDPAMGASGAYVYDVATFTLQYFVALPDPDGIVVGGGALAGRAYANCNDGTVREFVYDVNPANGIELEPPGAPVVNIITAGGTRGDFVVAEPIPFTFSGGPSFFGPSLVFTQSESLWRIDPPDSCFYGPPLFDQPLQPPVESYCFGDGSGALCPCGNFGSPGHGCANSLNAGGASISSTGWPALDDVVLHATGMTGTTCIFLQGSVSTAETVFGDGLNCAGGSLLRLRSVSFGPGVASIASFPVPPETITLSARGGVIPGSGTVRSYAGFYRNAAAAFCPPSTFNITNGLRVTW